MNGRIYDAKLGRFLQADPFIQAASNTQSYNRYSYVWNNPLNATDPSGFFFKKLWNEIRPFVIVAVVLCVYAGCAGSAETMAWVGGLSGAVGAAANGADLSGIILGAVTGLAGGSGNLWVGALTAGAAAYMTGGSFGRGFVAASVAGGIASEITGGKFANGASTAAFMWAIQAGANRWSGGESPSLTEEEIENKLKGLYEKDSSLKADRANAKAAIEKLYDDGVLSDDQRFNGQNAEDKAALHLSTNTAEITKKYNVEIGGYLYRDGNGVGYTTPVVGIRTTIPAGILGRPSFRAPKGTKINAYWHNHPSGTKAEFSGGDIGFARAKSVNLNAYVYSDLDNFLVRYNVSTNSTCTVNSGVNTYAPICSY